MTTILLTFWLRKHGISKILCGIFIVVFATVEGIFFIANLFKFTHGGWYSLFIAAIIAAIMIIWRNSTLKRAKFIELRPIHDYTGLISAIKSDNEIPKFSSNLVYLSRSSNKSMIESKLIYSIINKQPKRADHYWFIHIDHVDDPDALEYETSIIVPQTIYYVTLRIGFRVEPQVSVYLRQIVEDLVNSGNLDLTSSYPSLRDKGIPGDFRFIILHRIFSQSSNCPKSTSRLMRMHDIIRHIGISDRKAFGLDTSIVTSETVPLIINTSPGRRITKITH